MCVFSHNAKMWIQRFALLVVVVGCISLVVSWLFVDLESDCRGLDCFPPGNPATLGHFVHSRAESVRNGTSISILANMWTIPGASAPTPPIGAGAISAKLAADGLLFGPGSILRVGTPPLTGSKLGILVAVWARFLWLDMRGLDPEGPPPWTHARLTCAGPPLIRDRDPEIARTPFLDGELIYALGDPEWLYGRQRVGLSGLMNQVGADRPDDLNRIPALVRSLAVLWIREHNRWAMAFHSALPWPRGGTAVELVTDEYLFWMARSMVIEQIRAITILEWLPALRSMIPGELPHPLERIRLRLEQSVRGERPLELVAGSRTDPCLGAGIEVEGRLSAEWVALGGAWDAVVPPSALEGTTNMTAGLWLTEGGDALNWFNASVAEEAAALYAYNTTISAWNAVELGIGPLGDILRALGWPPCDDFGGGGAWRAMHPDVAPTSASDCRIGAWVRIQYGLWLTQLYALMSADPEGTTFRPPLQWQTRASQTRIGDIVERDMVATTIDSLLPRTFVV